MGPAAVTPSVAPSSAPAGAALPAPPRTGALPQPPTAAPRELIGSSLGSCRSNASAVAASATLSQKMACHGYDASSARSVAARRACALAHVAAPTNAPHKHP